MEVNNNDLKSHQIIQSEDEGKLARLAALTKHQDHVILSSSNTSNIMKAQNKFEEEKSLLDWFGKRFKDERNFCKHRYSKYFTEIFENILKNRVSNPDFTEKTLFENSLRYFICIRLVTRDPRFQKEFVRLNGVDCLAKQLSNVTDNYLTHCEDCHPVDILNNICSILLKITKSNRDVLVSHNIHVEMIKLLHASDTFILHCVLLILIELSESLVICSLIHDLQKVDFIVRVVQEFDESSRIKASEFLLKLCENKDIREQLIIFDCLPILLSVLHDGCHCVLLRNIVWILVLLCKDSQHMREIRHLGGIPLLLTLLQDDRSFTVDRHQVSSANMRTGRSKHILSARNTSGDGASTQELLENVIQLKIACCTALSELGLDDHNTETIVEGNGIYKIAKLILPQSEFETGCRNSILHLQRTAFRALRFLFSMERNRRLFKRLFPTDMYRMFIDIGHYVRDQKKYSPLVETLNSLNEDDLQNIKYGIEELNENKTPRRIVKGQYAVIDVLGSGAFGTVYKVKKENEEKPLALKEVSVFIGGMDLKGGKNKQKKRDLEEVVQELTIIKEQLRHPNVVRYYRTFRDSDKLYIEMQLIEGASLQEHFVSLEEKGEKGIGETRIWRVFIQICLALRYLHVEKKIVHRDLTPNNIMLGENDHVTITDFGLAKQKQKESKLYSMVGTLVYSCPEIIKSEPYGEKADIWALGCILYQMTTLKPPFPADNMLSLANKIVESKFEPISDTEEYSSLINYTVTKCLTVNPDDRPDIIGVVGLIAAPMLSYTDRITVLYHSCQRRLEKEWKHTQRNYHEAKRNKQDFRILLQANQDRLSLSNFQSFTQTEQVSSFNPSVSSPATFTATTSPNGFKLSPGETTSPTSDVFSNSSSSSSSIPDNLTDFRRPFPPQSRPNSGKDAVVARPAIPCRALSFDMSEQPLIRDNLLSRGCSSARGRPLSASNASTLTISPRKVRQINDPAQTMLHQLHKIIYIDQLPPTTEVNFMRKMISRYKRALFSSQSTSINLKTELKKLMSGSNDLIGACLSIDTSSLARQAAAEAEAKEFPGNGVLSVNTSPSSVSEEGLTYSKMNNMIEKVLCEIGYYDMSSQAVMKSRDFNFAKPFSKQKA